MKRSLKCLIPLGSANVLPGFKVYEPGTAAASDAPELIKIAQSGARPFVESNPSTFRRALIPVSVDSQSSVSVGQPLLYHGTRCTDVAEFQNIFRVGMLPSADHPGVFCSPSFSHCVSHSLFSMSPDCWHILVCQMSLGHLLNVFTLEAGDPLLAWFTACHGDMRKFFFGDLSSLNKKVQQQVREFDSYVDFVDNTTIYCSVLREGRCALKPLAILEFGRVVEKR